MLTMDLIVCTIAVSMGLLDPSLPAVRALLLQLGAQMPKAEAVVREVVHAAPGDRLLAKRALAFDFC